MATCDQDEVEKGTSCAAEGLFVLRATSGEEAGSSACPREDLLLPGGGVVPLQRSDRELSSPEEGRSAALDLLLLVGTDRARSRGG